MKPSVLRTVLAGISGGFAMNLAMLLTFRLIGFGWRGKGILLDPDMQSRKLIAVWTEIEPLPLVVNNPFPIVTGIILFGIAHAFAYRWISPGWPEVFSPGVYEWQFSSLSLSFVFGNSSLPLTSSVSLCLLSA